MSSSLSETAIANMGVSVLDDVFITNLTSDDSSVSRFMSFNFAFARDELLRQFPWSFAKKIARQAKEASHAHTAWRYAYRLPSDCVRLLPLRYKNAHNGPLIPYEKIGNIVYTDYADENGSLPITYIERKTNAADFDPLFARSLGYYLALLGSHGITGKQAYTQKCESLFNQTIAGAWLTDSLERGTMERYETDGSAVDVRTSGDAFAARLAG